jgi:hypothetical protein
MSPAIHRALAGLADALQDVLASYATRAIAHQIGCHHSTVAERGPMPTAWPLADLLALAEEHPVIADALRALFAAQDGSTSDATVERASHQLLASMGGEIQRLAERLADGTLDDAELRATDAEFTSLAAQISQARAVIRARRKRA